MAIQLISDCLRSETRVPNQFIDKYMPEANGEFVKVYLYLLKCIESNSTDCSVSKIADKFDHTEKDVIRALKYWERQKLISLQFNGDKKIESIHFLPMENETIDYSASNTALNSATIAASNIISQVAASNEAALESQSKLVQFTMEVPVVPASTATVATPIEPVVVQPASVVSNSEPAVPQPASVVSNPEPAVIPASNMVDNTVVPGFTAASPILDVMADEKPSSSTPAVPDKRDYTLDEVKNFRKNSDITELFFIIETYLKHPLSTAETNTVLYWYGELGFSTDVIEYLVEYCISKGHSSVRYMDKVAIGWKENDVKTVEQAKENSAMHSQAYYAVMKALGISGRNLVESEMNYIQKWTKEYKFNTDLIKEACGRTISAIHQPSFEYTDSILTDWNKNNVTSIKDIKALDAAYKKTRKAPAQAPESTQTANKYNKFNNFKQRTYDSDQLEKVLLTTSVQ